jgi:hypothetical protein
LYSTLLLFLHTYVYCSAILISQALEVAQMPSNWWMVKNIWYIYIYIYVIYILHIYIYVMVHYSAM